MMPAGRPLRWTVGVILAAAIAHAAPAGLDASRKHLFAGGMAVRAAWLSTDNGATAVTGVGSGVAGRLLFRLGPVVSAGGMGGTLHVGYRDAGIDGSYVSLGWGGLVADAGLHRGRVRASAGLIVGGCGATNLHITQRSADTVTAVFLRRGSWLVSPLITCDVLLTHTISAMVSADCFVARDLAGPGLMRAPGLQFGILFNK